MEASRDAAVIVQPGHLLGRYELLAEVARGGMASVWLARARGRHGFEKLVAIKTILPEHANEPEFHALLIDESRIAAGIDHPNVVHVFDVGDDGGVLHVVMEWLEGDSLQKIVRKLHQQNRKIPAPLAARIIADACAGLHAAHELTNAAGQPRDVVHRDVSPQNLIVTPQGVVKVIDFGVAKAVGRLAGNTTTGFVRGKLRYMPPEQAAGKKVDRRADIWALGAVLRVVLTGAGPYEAENEMAMMSRIARNEPADPVPDYVPAPIARVLDRTFALDPSRRHATAAELRTALESALDELDEHPTSEDVARFLEYELPDLAEARRRFLDAARAREEAGSSAASSVGGVASATGAMPDEASATEPNRTALFDRARLSEPGSANATAVTKNDVPLPTSRSGVVRYAILGAFALLLLSAVAFRASRRDPSAATGGVSSPATEPRAPAGSSPSTTAAPTDPSAAAIGADAGAPPGPASASSSGTGKSRQPASRGPRRGTPPGRPAPAGHAAEEQFGF